MVTLLDTCDLAVVYGGNKIRSFVKGTRLPGGGVELEWRRPWPDLNGVDPLSVLPGKPEDRQWGWAVV